MFRLKDRPEEALTLPWLASFRQEGQQSIEMPFNRQLKRRNCVSSRSRDRAPGARARAMVWWRWGRQRFSHAAHCLQVRRSAADLPPCRCDPIGQASWFFRRVLSDRPGQARKPRKNAATKNGVAGPPGRPSRRCHGAQDRSTDAAHPTPLQLAPNNRQGQRRWGRRRESQRPDFRQRSAFRQNPGRRRGRGKRSCKRKRKRDAARRPPQPRARARRRASRRARFGSGRPAVAWGAARSRRNSSGIVLGIFRRNHAQANNRIRPARRGGTI